MTGPAMTGPNPPEPHPCALCQMPTTRAAPSWWPVADEWVCEQCRYENARYDAMAQAYGPGNQHRDPDGWPAFRGTEELRAAPPMTRDMLPRSLEPFAVDIAERMDLPLEFCAVPMLVAASALLGARVVALAQARGDWWQAGVLWGTVVGNPSVGKTPAEAQALQPFHEVVGEAEARHRAQQGEEDEEDPLRYQVSDTTTEKLVELMSKAPLGHAMFLHSSELAGLFSTFSKKGRETDRAFYLQVWDLRTPVVVDRIGRGSLRAHCGLALYGAITPGVLSKHVGAAKAGGVGADGLLQRFGLAVHPEVAGTYEPQDRPPAADARARATAAFQRLATLNAKALGAERIPTVPFPGLRFAADAQPVFDRWERQQTIRVRSNREGMSEAFLGHLGKHRGLVPALALLFHVLDHERGRSKGIDIDSLERALSMVAYLEQHAARIYGEGERHAAVALAAQIRAGLVEDGVALRDVHRAQRSGIRNAADARAGARRLECMGWLRLERQGPRGAQTVIRLRPDLAGCLARGDEGAASWEVD